ncbi:protein mahjong isoform X2 [Euwallacea fornicatus]|uniref:protein mahjong isoform X2 n=1 Tax=Euwallacea fornicatus TaxID=995702 RepID=UPI0033902C7A
MEDLNTQSAVTEASGLIKTWDEQHSQPDYNAVPVLTRLAEILEVETENYLKMDPDPFDERHPSRTDPDCKLGQILKIIFRKDNFMSKLLNDYMRDTFYSRNNITDRDIDQLNIAACRLLLDLMPGLETSVVFQDVGNLIHRLIKWVTNSVEPLQSYATGILAAAMDIPEIAAKFREENSRLVPLLLQRLKRLKNSSEFAKNSAVSHRPFAHFASMTSPPYRGDGVIRINLHHLSNGVANVENNENDSGERSTEQTEESANTRKRRNPSLDHNFASPQSPGSEQNKPKCIRLDTDSIVNIPSPASSPHRNCQVFSETSNSNWAELETFMIGSIQMFPPTIATRQILILRYLTPIGEYQEFLSHVFHENTALDLILTYVNIRVTKEARLAFEALKYLAALLCHKKFSIEFLQRRGLEALLEVPRPSIAATGVSICLYYLGYCEEAMERVCLLPKYIITNLVKYALWLLECSHDSGKCQAIMFFGLTFQFKIILDEFDAQDGLRKLHNVISTLPILQTDHEMHLNEDQECASRQIVRHVCVAYRRYLEAHLYHKAEMIKRNLIRPNERPSAPVLPALPAYKACKLSPEEIQQNIELLLQNMPFRSHWVPVDQLLKLGDITLILKIIALAFEWNYGGRGETIRSALEVLAIACIMPKVVLLLCEKVDLPEERLTVGFSIILGAAEGEVVYDPDVQKAALRVIVNSVCAPINRVGGNVSRFSQGNVNSPSRKIKFKSSEDLIQKVWDCVRSNSGILVLIQLMNCKTPITDADSIRTLACESLAGLARCETVRQIVSKLPLFTSGELQNLMRDPILQEKRQEHVAFQKYALELLGRLSGHRANGLELSPANIHRIHKANVVAQTKIQFSDRQLLQLMHQHLISKGFINTAGVLVKEACLGNSIMPLSAQHPNKFRYISNLTPVRTPHWNPPTPTRSILNSSDTVPSTSTSPATIRIIKRSSSIGQSSPTMNSRLQKPWSNEMPVVRQLLPPDESHDQPPVTLDSIVTEYLTNQHAVCKNPITTCPQFNLFVRHKCPDPKPKLMTVNNFVMRNARRQFGYQSKTMDMRLVHSRFCPVQMIRPSTEEVFFTQAKYLPGTNSVIVGDSCGDVRIFDRVSGNEEHTFSAHDNFISYVEPNRRGDLVLTCSTWGEPISALWSLKDFEIKLPFHDEDMVEFSKLSQDKVIATKGEVAMIYDVNTGQNILRLAPQLSNLYTKNKATFSWNDELVLTDGVLFDVNSGKVINRLDKLNQTQNGVFHPNGMEIISNTEVWDMRTETKTLHLLKTVPALDQCAIIFSPINSVLYAVAVEQDLDASDSSYATSFKTIDSTDYSSIATIEVKKNIYDLSINCYDSQIVLVENHGVMYNTMQESVVRFYDVGRRKDDEDEQDDEEDEDDDMDNDNSDDDGSDGGGRVIINLGASDNNDDNNDNGDSDDSSWTTTSSGSDTSGDIGDILFEY